MLTATLGGLIKDYRLKKRLSQLEVSLRIGWKDSTRLSKIEQGRVGRPSRKTVDKIIKALELNQQAKGEFLLIGGYLPNEEEIKWAIKYVLPKLSTLRSPAYITDFSWRCLYMNSATAKALGFPEELAKNIPKTRPNLLEFVIAPKDIMPVEIFKGDDEQSLKPFGIAQTSQFKVEQAGRENDLWLKKLLGRLMKNTEFRKLWSQSGPGSYHKRLLDYEYKVIKWPDGKIEKYHVFTSRIISDIRFQLTIYLPIS